VGSTCRPLSPFTPRPDCQAPSSTCSACSHHGTGRAIHLPCTRCPNAIVTIPRFPKRMPERRAATHAALPFLFPPRVSCSMSPLFSPGAAPPSFSHWPSTPPKTTPSFTSSCELTAVPSRWCQAEHSIDTSPVGCHRCVIVAGELEPPCHSKQPSTSSCPLRPPPCRLIPVASSPVPRHT
jgi:hypothetical protein